MIDEKGGGLTARIVCKRVALEGGRACESHGESVRGGVGEGGGYCWVFLLFLALQALMLKKPSAPACGGMRQLSRPFTFKCE